MMSWKPGTAGRNVTVNRAVEVCSWFSQKKNKIIVTKKCMSEGMPTVITFDSESRNKGLLTS